MNIKKVMAETMSVGLAVATLGFGALGAGPGVASADPPWAPGPGHDGPGHHDGNYRGDARWNDRDYWRTRPGKWWNDVPPWGLQYPPPAYVVGPLPPPGGPPPAPVNYYGQWANPVWDPGFRTWGIWLFGVFIPIVGVGVA